LGHRSSNRQPKTYVKPEAAITVLEPLMMGSVSPETCLAIKKRCGCRLPLRWPSQRQPATKKYVKPEAAITVLELLMMGGESPETC